MTVIRHCSAPNPTYPVGRHNQLMKNVKAPKLAETTLFWPAKVWVFWPSSPSRGTQGSVCSAALCVRNEFLVSIPSTALLNCAQKGAWRVLPSMRYSNTILSIVTAHASLWTRDAKPCFCSPSPHLRITEFWRGTSKWISVKLMWTVNTE